MNVRLITKLSTLGPGNVTDVADVWVYQFSPAWEALPPTGATIALEDDGDDHFLIKVGNDSTWFEGRHGVIELGCDNTYYSADGTQAWTRENVEARLRSAGFLPVDEVELW